jgi:predicted SprT family Zn-dependent metalloprotease
VCTARALVVDSPRSEDDSSFHEGSELDHDDDDEEEEEEEEEDFQRPALPRGVCTARALVVDSPRSEDDSSFHEGSELDHDDDDEEEEEEEEEEGDWDEGGTLTHNDDEEAIMLDDDSSVGGFSSPAASVRAPKDLATVRKPLKKSSKRDLVEASYREFNREVFQNRLPHSMEIKWNNRLRTTAGLTYTSRTALASTVQHNARIELAEKVLTDEHRLRSTLLHEMCHAAAWIVDHNNKPPHGPVFRKWAAAASRVYPDYTVRTCHAYEIQYKYQWECTSCGLTFGRHSRSIDESRQRCGACRGQLRPIGNTVPTSEKKPPSGFSAFVKQHYASTKQRLAGAAHAAVMRELSSMWKQRKSEFN